MHKVVEKGLFMVVMAAFLNGCYGYLHTRYGVELRLAVLFSAHFCLTTDSFSLVEVWGVTKEPAGGRDGEEAVMMTVAVMKMTMTMMMPGKACGEATVYLSSIVPWSNCVFTDIQEHVEWEPRTNNEDVHCFMAIELKTNTNITIWGTVL